MHINESFNGYGPHEVNAVLKRKGGIMALGNGFPDAPDWLQRVGISKIESAFAPLKAFTSIFDPNPYQPKVKNMIKYVKSGSMTLVDETANFQQGGSNVDGLEVSVSHYSQPWPISPKDLQSGVREEDLFFANAQELANTLATVIGFYFSPALFPTAPVTVAQDAFGLSDAADAYSKIPGRTKNLILHTRNFARLAHASPRGFLSGEAAHGWSGIFDLSTGWTGKVVGLACAPTGIVTVSGLLTQPLFGSGIMQRRLIGLAGLDLMVEWNRWFDGSTRTLWNSLDAIFGATVGQDNAGVCIVTP